MADVKRVLIVDDEPDILKAVEFRVRKAGYQTVTAQDGPEGMEKARSEKPDLILLDYKLPGVSGVEVYKKLKSEDSLKDIPVVFITASKGNEDLKAEMEKIGAKNVLLKPYEPEELLSKIKELIG